MADFFDEITKKQKIPKDLVALVLKKGSITVEDAATELDVAPTRILDWSQALEVKGYVRVIDTDKTKTITRGKKLNAAIEARKKSTQEKDTEKKQDNTKEEDDNRKSIIAKLQNKILEEKKKRTDLEDRLEEMKRECESKLKEETEKLDRLLERERVERKKLERILDIKRSGQDPKKEIDEYLSEQT
ncbi:MAG: hypothetical protein KKD39_09185 [Candidatus Altiarchaeota archaeon]|nr:hypothetical protein [Candidatus Altiarchaeota archaeon]